MMKKKLKKLLKKIPGASFIGYKSLELRGGLRTLKHMRLKTVPKRILFNASGGRYHDSCKAIAEYLHRAAPEVEIVWSYRNSQTIKELPDYITFITTQELEAFGSLTVCCHRGFVREKTSCTSRSGTATSP